MKLDAPVSKNDLQLDAIVDAAGHALHNQRCRESYLHELRGGLQALSSSLELLTRAVQKGASEFTTIEKATSLAKRALANHERSAREMLEQLVGDEDAPTVVNLATLSEAVRRFLQADAAGREVRVTIDAEQNLQIQAPSNRLRRLLLDLVTLVIDGSPPGSQLQLRLHRVADSACIEMRGPRMFTAQDYAQPAITGTGNIVSRAQLVLAGASRWLPTLGGRFEIAPSAETMAVLRIYCPLADA